MQDNSFREEKDSTVPVQIKVYITKFNTIYLDLEISFAVFSAFKRKTSRNHLEEYQIEVLLWNIKKELIKTEDWHYYKDAYNCMIEKIVREENLSVEKAKIYTHSPHPTHF